MYFKNERKLACLNITLSYKNVKIIEVGTQYLFQAVLFFAPSIRNYQEQTIMDNWSSRMTFYILV